MAILALFNGPHINKEQYDILRREVGWETRHAEGGILHVASFDAHGGAHVADVWESQHALDTFVATRLMPAFQKHHIEPPQVEVFPVHNLNAYHAIDRFVLKK